MKAHYNANNNVYRLVLVICVVLFFGITSVFLVLGSLQGSWSDWRQATCMPDSCFCEKPRGTLLQQPTNTYSNLTFCLVGCIIYAMIARTLDQPSKEDAESVFWVYATVYATGCVLLGLGSGLYHASMVFAFQVVDNVGMYFIICWAFTYNLVRLSPERFQQAVFYSTYFSQIALFTYINIAFPVVRRYAFFVMVIIYIVSEYYVDVKKRGELSAEDYQMNWTVWFLALGSIALGFFLWNMDQNKVWCDPTSLFQLHGVWHSLCALSSFLLFYFYWTEKKKPADMRLIKNASKASTEKGSVEEEQELMNTAQQEDEAEEVVDPSDVIGAQHVIYQQAQQQRPQGTYMPNVIYTNLPPQQAYHHQPVFISTPQVHSEFVPQQQSYGGLYPISIQHQ